MIGCQEAHNKFFPSSFLFLPLHRKGDYHRYMAEYSSGEGRQKAAEASLQSYQSAAEVAKGANSFLRFRSFVIFILVLIYC